MCIRDRQWMPVRWWKLSKRCYGRTTNIRTTTRSRREKRRTPTGKRRSRGSTKSTNSGNTITAESTDGIVRRTTDRGTEARNKRHQRVNTEAKADTRTNLSLIHIYFSLLPIFLVFVLLLSLPVFAVAALGKLPSSVLTVVPQSTCYSLSLIHI